MNERSFQKQTFLQGTAILALGTVLVKLIGFLFKTPLNSIIGSTGFGYFNTAYTVYNVLLMISTTGLPVAMSRMISEAQTLGNHAQIRRIFRTALYAFLTIGILGTAGMLLLSRQLSVMVTTNENSWAAIAALAPCVLFICLISAYRGFFQGQSNMIPTSISQVVEAVVKLIVGMAAALILLKTTRSVPLAAGGAILGVTASCLVSSVYLYVCFRKSYVYLPVTDDSPRSYADTAKGLLLIAVPITVGSAILQFFTMMETKIYMGQLLNLGYSQGAADTMRGIYGMCLTIFNMPCAFITPITISIIPAITAQLTLCNYKEAKATEESAVRITGLVSMPCAFGLALLARPITALLGRFSGTGLDLAEKLMFVLAVAIAFNAIVMVTTAIMQAHGHAGRPVTNMLIGGVLNLIAVYVLTGNPDINILGTPIGILVCYVSISILNLLSLRTLIEEPPAVARNLLRPFLSAALMGLGVTGCYKGLMALGVDSRLVLCALPVVVGVAIYAVAAVRLRAITRSDCLLLPKGQRIADFLKL